MLQAIKVKGHVNGDGILKLEVPVEYPNQDVEAVVVVQTLMPQPAEAESRGLPAGFFDELDQIEADDMIERPDQGVLELREPIE